MRLRKTRWLWPGQLCWGLLIRHLKFAHLLIYCVRQPLIFLRQRPWTMGMPKGVAMTHRAAAAFVDAEARWFLADDPQPLGPDDRVLAGLSVAFDASCEEMWLAWRHGGCLVPAPRSLVRPGISPVHSVQAWRVWCVERVMDDARRHLFPPSSAMVPSKLWTAVSFWTRSTVTASAGSRVLEGIRFPHRVVRIRCFQCS